MTTCNSTSGPGSQRQLGVYGIGEKSMRSHYCPHWTSFPFHLAHHLQLACITEVSEFYSQHRLPYRGTWRRVRQNLEKIINKAQVAWELLKSGICGRKGQQAVGWVGSCGIKLTSDALLRAQLRFKRTRAQLKMVQSHGQDQLVVCFSKSSV